ncbi:MAG: hypothetical protein Q3966_04435 [Neisseria sp.]|nr:hypothetical protein [Neisseria sp.]
MLDFYQENIQEPAGYLHPFPSAADIFAPQQPWLQEHFLPLVSIDLAVLNPDWTGQTLHMVSPIEPYEGYIGENTLQHHNEYTAPNWLAFRLTQDNRYEFLGKEGFFERSPANGYSGEGELEEHAAELRAQYQKSREHFAKHGFLVNPYYREPNRENLLDSLGGGFCYGNWTEGADIPSAFTLSLPPAGTRLNDLDELPDDGIEIAYKGNRFHFIAEVSAHNYCDGADAVILMYEPVSRIVLLTFDYS